MANERIGAGRADQAKARTTHNSAAERRAKPSRVGEIAWAMQPCYGDGRVGGRRFLAQSEPLRDTGQDGAAETELWRTDTDTGTIADLVCGVADIQHVQPQFGPGRQLLHDRQVDHAVGG